MPQYITDTAQMQCDKGATPSNLKVTSQSFVTIESKIIATEQDKIPNTNIPTFGVCSVTQKSCIPQPQEWQKTSDFDCVNDLKKLTKDSFCICSLGGKIQFNDTGQIGFVECEQF